MSEYEYKISAPLRNLITFTGSDGKPVLVIDGEKRRIEVSEGVDVSEAAQAVLAAMGAIWPGRIATQERDRVLEEAAHECDALYDGYSTANTDQTDPEQVWLDACDRAATAIRALKEKRDD